MLEDDGEPGEEGIQRSVHDGRIDGRGKDNGFSYDEHCIFVGIKISGY